VPTAVERRPGRAPRTVLAWLLAIACLPALPAAAAGDADPYDLLEACRIDLAEGRLEDAAATLSRLRRLLRDTPGWDPDGTFSERLLPDLERRIGPLRQAVARLDALYRERWQAMQPPGRLLAQGNMRAYVNHVTDLMLQIREERDAIVAGIPSLEDRAVLYETAAHDRIRTVLDTGVLQRLHAAADDVVQRLEQEARAVREMETRQDGSAGAGSSADSLDSESGDLAAARQRLESYLGALAAMVTEGAGVSGEVGLQGREAVADVMAALIEQRIAAQRRATSQTPRQREERLRGLDRLRHYNDVLARARIAGDQGDRLDELATLIEATPVDVSPEEAGPSAAAAGGTSPGRRQALATMLLAAGAGAAGLLIRRRRTGSPRSRS
jgi:hypothetical protein